VSNGVEIIGVAKDSVSTEGIRLTTLHLRYWRPIHGQVMTHRVFTRNARSSRAVPTRKLLAEKPYVPKFSCNKPGMQAGEPLRGWRKLLAEATWRGMVTFTKLGVLALHFAGVHKQWANRPLEWFGYIDVLVTSTEWANFLALRCHKDAEPEIQALANGIYRALSESTPELLFPGQWHLPYVETARDPDRGFVYYRETERGKEHLPLDVARKVSAARCAAISYKPFDGDGSLEKEIARFVKLVGGGLVHATPTEHQATPDRRDGGLRNEWMKPHRHGNFHGWIQHRKLLGNENIRDYKGILR
jgi:hypothetical protein